MTQPGSPLDQSPGSAQDEVLQSPPPQVDEAEPSLPSESQPRGQGPPPTWARTLTSTTAEPGPAGLYYADVPDRIIALIVDVILLAIIGFILTLLLGGLFGGLATSPSLVSAGGGLNLGVFLLVSIAQLAISLGYFGYSWTALRGTPGMKLLGLRIGHEADGRSIERNQALIRWLILGIPSALATFAAYVSDVLGLILSVAGVIWLAVLLYTVVQSPSKQGLHDRYAHSILIKAGRRPA